MLSCTITYDIVTETSVVDGDTADNGYIQPKTESRRSFSNGRSRDIARNRRMARVGKFSWSLRDALAFLDRQSCANHETCWNGSADHMAIYCTSAYQGADIESFHGSDVVSVSYALHVEGLSYGSFCRLARMLDKNGVYFTNVSALRRKAG